MHLEGFGWKPFRGENSWNLLHQFSPEVMGFSRKQWGCRNKEEGHWESSSLGSEMMCPVKIQGFVPGGRGKGILGQRSSFLCHCQQELVDDGE